MKRRVHTLRKFFESLKCNMVSNCLSFQFPFNYIENIFNRFKFGDLVGIANNFARTALRALRAFAQFWIGQLSCKNNFDLRFLLFCNMF